jgi:hypothetical protein
VAATTASQIVPNGGDVNEWLQLAATCQTRVIESGMAQSFLMLFYVVHEATALTDMPGVKDIGIML